jgi:hypothetical protein
VNPPLETVEPTAAARQVTGGFRRVEAEVATRTRRERVVAALASAKVLVPVLLAFLAGALAVIGCVARYTARAELSAVRLASAAEHEPIIHHLTTHDAALQQIGERLARMEGSLDVLVKRSAPHSPQPPTR